MTCITKTSPPVRGGSLTSHLPLFGRGARDAKHYRLRLLSCRMGRNLRTDPEPDSIHRRQEDQRHDGAP